MSEHDPTDPRARLMELLGHTFTQMCERPDGLEYARRFFDGRVSFHVDMAGVRVFDKSLTEVDPEDLP